MSRQRDSFGEAFGTTVGVGLGIGLVVLVFNGAKLVFETLADYNQWRVNNPSEFDASVIEGMRARGWATPEARAFWDSLLLWPYEKQRIEAKLKFARPPVIFLPPLKTCTKCGEQYYGSVCYSQTCRPPQRRKCAKCSGDFLSTYSIFRGGYAVTCKDCRPKKKAARRRRNTTVAKKASTPPQRLEGRKRLQLSPAPAEAPAPEEQVAPTPVAAAKPAKQTKRHGKSGRMAKDTKDRAIYYAGLRVNKGVSHRAALLRTAQHFAHGGHREDALLRSVRTAVRNHLDNGRDLGKLRRFLENASKRA